MFVYLYKHRSPMGTPEVSWLWMSLAHLFFDGRECRERLDPF